MSGRRALPHPTGSGARRKAAPRRLTFLAGVTRIIAIVAGDPQDPVLDGSHPVGGRLDIHRERGAAAPGAAGRRAQRGARELVQVLPPPPPVLMLQLVLPRPGSDSTARRGTGSASQRRRWRRRRRSGPHSGRPLRQSAWQLSRPPPGALLPEQRPLTSDAHRCRGGCGRPTWPQTLLVNPSAPLPRRLDIPSTPPARRDALSGGVGGDEKVRDGGRGSGRRGGDGRDPSGSDC